MRLNPFRRRSRSESRATTFRVLRPFLVPRWPSLAVAAGSSVVVALADLARPFPLAIVVDHLLADQNAPFALTRSDWIMLIGVALVVLAIALVDAGASYLVDVELQRAGAHIVHDLRTAVYDHMQRLSLGFHDNRQAGELVTGVTGDVNAVGGLFSDAIGPILTSVLFLIGMLVVTFIMDPVIAITACAVIPILTFASARFRRRMRTLAKEQRAIDGQIASLATETLSSMRVVKSLGTEPFERGRLRDRSDLRRDAEIRGARLEGRFGGTIDVLGAIGSAIVLVLGVVRVSRGLMSPGELIILASYVKRIYKPLSDITRRANRITQATARADRVAEILASDDMLRDRNVHPPADRAVGSLEIRDVTFAYDPERPVLRGTTLSVQPGERVAVMGPSGEGKSTLAALIARFYDPSEGSIELDGRDLRSMPLTWLRSQVGVVLQDTVLFTGTVAENIAYGVSASQARIEDAARAAGAHGFIEALPQAYETPLGPRGVALSGGQRQRISIARTLLRNPPLLVLDEPTTGLDRESEREVLRGLDRLMHGRTTIIITHAEALAATADRVVTMREGRVGAGAAGGAAPALDVIADQDLADVGDHPLVALDLPVFASEAPRTVPFESGAEPSGFGDEDDAWVSEGDDAPPPDPALPMLPSLLRTWDVAASLQSIAGPDRPIARVGVDRISYLPGERVVVHYVVKFADGDLRHVTATATPDDRLERRVRRESAVELAHQVNGRSGVSAPLAFDTRLRALIQWLPLDLKLPALATQPVDLRRRLLRAGLTADPDGDDGTLLRYRPRRRAVVRVDDHVVKFYAHTEHFQAAAAGLLVSARLPSIRTPRMEAVLFDLQATVQSFESGSTPVARNAAGRMGGVLSELHACPTDALLPFSPARAQFREAMTTATLLARVAPELGDGLDRVCSMLSWTMPDDGRAVTSHGDLHVRQFLETQGGLTLVDFDHMCSASPAFDMSTVAAHEVTGREGDLERSSELLELALEGYGSVPDDLDWFLAVGILRRAARPLRHFAGDWRDRVARIVDDASTLLERQSV
jgi:ATP-binding cassette subfamily B protein